MNPERAKLFIELMKSNTYLFATGVFVAFDFDLSTIGFHADHRLFHRHRLRQIPRLIDITTTHHGNVI